MKIPFLALLIILLSVSCKKSTELSSVIISGDVLSSDISVVKFLGVIDNSIGGFGKQYTATTDSSSKFSIDIPIERIAKCRISVGDIYQNMVLLPGDQYHIEIFKDSISYKGKGAEKNTFLVSLENAGLGDRDYSAEYNKCALSPIEFEEVMNIIRAKRISFLNDYPEKVKLEREFVEYFLIVTDVIYDFRLQSYPRKYSRKNKFNIDSLEIPNASRSLSYFGNISNDKNVISFDYVHSLRNYVSRKVYELYLNDSTLSREEARRSILLDSLKGRTREYILAQWLISDLSMNSLDTSLYNSFQEIVTEENPKKTVEEYYLKFKVKQALIGKPIHKSFSETMIIDTAGTQLFFKDIINKYKGEVIYLDLWSLQCAPCISAMPHSKLLRERLEGLPIEFVYIAQDPHVPNVWDNIFEISFTDRNHYLMAKSDWGSSKMLQFLEINWVPCYMIIDKQGNLIDFNAPGPYVQDNGESELEKRLRQLANV